MRKEEEYKLFHCCIARRPYIPAAIADFDLLLYRLTSRINNRWTIRKA